MRVAFYAPLKSPNSPVPSGDRRMARALIEAMELGGHSVTIASEFQAREPQGSPKIQAALRAEGAQIATALIASYRALAATERPEIWFTYHLYYKAMDWLGPMIAAALDIPYVAAEVSYAPKRAGGPWDLSHRALAEVIKSSAAILGLNSLDSACLLPVMPDPEKLVPLKPFIAMPVLADRQAARAKLIADHTLNPEQPIMVTVAMMRDDAKLQSYRVLGAALKKCLDQDWQLLVVGDGPARSQVEALLGAAPVHFLGELAEAEIRNVLAGSDFFVWPAVNEAYGMAMLEAQAMGLPVLAGRSGGVADIIRDQTTGLLSEVGNAAAFADTLKLLLADAPLRKKMSEAAVTLIRPAHSIETAAAKIDQTLRGLIK